VTPQGRAQHSSAGRATLHSVEGGRGDARRTAGRPGGSGPTLVPVTSRDRPGGATRAVGSKRSASTGRGATPGRTVGTGRMQKGESPKARGERTRARIIDAVIALLSENEVAPTAKEVAGRAGVSVRLVFHHFEDMDALFRAVARAQIERHWLTVHPIPRALSLDQRIERTVHQRARLFEAVSPVRRKAASLAARHADVAEGLQLTNTMLRTWLEETFADELRAAKRDRNELLAALEAVASWEVWERLRRNQGMTSAGAQRVLSRLLRALLLA
jgi:TetR/AcrR family transcriptional regulator of autoinduction and epiphytic fitness